jgi:hypothetical protein
MSSRQTYGCLGAVAELGWWIWGALVWLASEFWSGFVVALWEQWRDRRE